MQTDKVNVDYIMNLIRDIDLTSDEKREEDLYGFSKEIGLSGYIIKDYVSEYEYSGCIT